jgi:ferredoxin
LTLWPEGEVLEMNGEESLLVQLTKAGKLIKSNCGGHASCSDCIIKVKGGESSFTAPTFEEMRLLGNIFHITKERLSCQAKLTGDASIDISAHGKAPVSSAPVPKSSKTLVRKRESLQETASKSQEKVAVKKEDDWYRHWDKPELKDESKPKHLGGNKRPKPFTDADYNDPDGDKE